MLEGRLNVVFQLGCYFILEERGEAIKTSNTAVSLLAKI
jgi:hypothetical protein